MIQLLLCLAAVAALYAFVFGFLSSITHLILVVIRKLLGHASGYRAIIAWRSLPFLAAIIITSPAHFGVSDHDLSPLWRFVWTALQVTAALPMIVFPVFLPLFEAWRERRSSSYILVCASLVALPAVAWTVAFFFAFGLADAGSQLTPGPFVASSELAVDSGRIFYDWDSDRSSCGLAIADSLGLPTVASSSSDWPSTREDFSLHEAAFWLQTTLDSLSSGALGTYDCHFSLLRANRHSATMSTIVFIFQYAYAVLFYAALAVIGREIFLRFQRMWLHPRRTQ